MIIIIFINEKQNIVLVHIMPTLSFTYSKLRSLESSFWDELATKI